MEQVIFKYLRAEPEDHYFLLVSTHYDLLGLPLFWDWICKPRVALFRIILPFLPNAGLTGILPRCLVYWEEFEEHFNDP